MYTSIYDGQKWAMVVWAKAGKVLVPVMVVMVRFCAGVGLRVEPGSAHAHGGGFVAVAVVMMGVCVVGGGERGGWTRDTRVSTIVKR